MTIRLQRGDVLVVTDVQSDFVTGSLAVAEAASIVPVLGRYIEAFGSLGLPVVATRDWHPPDHSSFVTHGGHWPVHCVAGTPGAAFVPGLALPPGSPIVSKATRVDHEAYSAFDETDMDEVLHRLHAKRLFVGGLATDYCVSATVHDALRRRYEVFVLIDAIRAVNLHPEDGGEALRRMLLIGARALRYEELDVAEHADG